MTTNETKHTPEFPFPVVKGMVAVEHARYIRDAHKSAVKFAGIVLSRLRAENAELVAAIETAANSIAFVLPSIPKNQQAGMLAIEDELRAALAKHAKGAA